MPEVWGRLRMDLMGSRLTHLTTNGPPPMGSRFTYLTTNGPHRWRKWVRVLLFYDGCGHQASSVDFISSFAFHFLAAEMSSLELICKFMKLGRRNIDFFFFFGIVEIKKTDLDRNEGIF